jgi:hypothetical protein
MGDGPVILSQPTNRTVWRDGTGRFGVSASGRPAPVYQWRFNGVDVPGATNAVLTLPAVRLAQAGTYRVAVSNLVETVLSAQASLVVKEFTIKRGGMVFQGGQFRMTIEAGAGERVMIEASDSVNDPTGWFPVYTNPPGATLIQFTDPAAGRTGPRFYRARVEP